MSFGFQGKIDQLIHSQTIPFYHPKLFALFGGDKKPMTPANSQASSPASSKPVLASMGQDHVIPMPCAFFEKNTSWNGESKKYVQNHQISLVLEHVSKKVSMTMFQVYISNVYVYVYIISCIYIYTHTLNFKYEYYIYFSRTKVYKF